MQRVSKRYTSQYKSLGTIGKGSFGEVERVEHIKTKRQYAMKLISNINSMVLDQIQMQVKIMKSIQSDYALKIFDNFYDDFENCYCIISDFYPKGDLKAYFQTKKIPDQPKEPIFNNDHEIISFIMQITLAFLQLNSKNIIHRDLKPANILVSDEGQFRVCDFGCSKFIEAEASKFLNYSNPFGTQLFNSPEIYFAEKNYNKTVDVWSLGIILYEILYRCHPVKTKNDVFVYEDVLSIFKGQKPIKFPEVKNINPLIIELLKLMLEIDCKKRIKWQGIYDYICQHFDYVIVQLEQVLDHYIFLTKSMCALIELLNKPENNQQILACNVQKKSFSTLVHCLISLQYDYLQQIEKILLKQIKPKKYMLILPHVFNEFKDKTKTIDFYLRKDKNKTFRDLISQHFPVEKVETSIEKNSHQILKSIASLEAKTTSLKKVVELLRYMEKLKTVCALKNTNQMQILCKSISN